MKTIYNLSIAHVVFIWFEDLVASVISVIQTNMAKSRYFCTQGLLQMLSVDEKAISEGISYVNRSYLDESSFSITNVLMIKFVNLEQYTFHFIFFQLRICWSFSQVSLVPYGG